MTGDIPRTVRLDRPGEDWRLSLVEAKDGYRAELTNTELHERVTVAIAQSAFTLLAQRSLDGGGLDRYEQPARIEIELTDAITEHLTNGPVVLAITGRSGSGKTTLAEAVMETLRERSVSSIILSTDDYNRGRSGLRALFGHNNHTNWDAHHVYDTLLMARHIQALKNGHSIPRHAFNFAESEPHTLVEGNVIDPAQVIIIEGIMANSPNLTDVTDLGYLMPTPLATCIGRRVLRDIKQGRAGAVASNPEELLRYQLEVAEPEYLSRL